MWRLTTPLNVVANTCSELQDHRDRASAPVTLDDERKDRQGVHHDQTNPHQHHTGSVEKQQRSLGRVSKASLAVAIGAALILGIWFTNASWRYRKLIWQVQAALVGGAVGFVAGRITAGKD